MPVSNVKKTRPIFVRALIVAAVAMLVYANNLGHDWTYDDVDYVSLNEYVSNPLPLGKIFSTTYLYGVDGQQTALYRPVTILSYSVNSALTGLRPSMFHLVNDLMHAVNSVLVFLVLSVVSAGSAAGFYSALLFAAHPIHTEAVNNVVGRAELLSFFFMMLSLYTFLLRDRNRKLYYPVSLVLFLAAVMSKETPAVLPIIIAFIAIARRIRGEEGNVKRSSLEAGGFFGVLFLYLALRHVVVQRLGPVPEVMMHDNPLAGMAFAGRLPTTLAVLGRYSALLLLPVRLSADYSFNQIPVLGTLFNGWALFGVIIALLTIAAGIIAAGRSREVFFGILMLGLPYLVISNIFYTVGTIMGERLLYIPSLGFAILAAWGVDRLFSDRLKMRKAAILMITGVTILYGGRTLVRNPDWKNNDAIFTKTAQASPNSVKTAYNYALVLNNTGRFAESIDWYRHAVAIWPGHYNAWFNLGNTLSRVGRFEESAAAYHKAIELMPEDTGTLHNLALTYRRMKQPEKAIETFEKLLQLTPGDISVRTNIGATWAESGAYDKALAVFESIAEDNPRDAGTLANIGNLCVMQGDSLKAESYYRRAIELDPSNPAANNAFLGLLISGNRLDEAEAKVRAMSGTGIPVSRRLLDQLEKLRNNYPAK